MAFTDRANPGESIFKDADQGAVPCQAERQARLRLLLSSARSLRSCARLPDAAFSAALSVLRVIARGRTHVQGTVCPACVPEEMRLTASCRRVCRRANTIFTPLREAAAAYYYADTVRTARFCAASGAAAFGMPGSWRTVMAVLVFGALPAKQPGKTAAVSRVCTALPLYSCIVPVPPRQAAARYAGSAAAAGAPVGRGAGGPGGDTAVHQASGAARRRSLPASSACKTRRRRVWLPPRHRPDRQAGAAGR